MSKTVSGSASIVPPTPKTSKPRTLARFAQDKVRANCPVCALPLDAQAQLATASDRKISRAVQLEWLRTEFGAAVTDDQLTAHGAGRHYAKAQAA